MGPEEASCLTKSGSYKCHFRGDQKRCDATRGGSRGGASNGSYVKLRK